MLRSLPPLANGRLRRRDRKAHPHLFRLRRKFERVSRRVERRSWLRRHRGALVYLLLLGAAIGWIGWNLYPAAMHWPIGTAFLHLAAAPDCHAARAVGLAPALRGNPGYHPRHDRDNDGIACEPWPPLRSRPRTRLRTTDEMENASGFAGDLSDRR